MSVRETFGRVARFLTAVRHRDAEKVRKLGGHALRGP